MTRFGLAVLAAVILGVLVSAAQAGRVNQGAGFTEHSAWSSLVGDINTDSLSHGFATWPGDDGRQRWGLNLDASGHFGLPLFSVESQQGEFNYSTLHLTWQATAPGPWYTSVQVTGGSILNQYPSFSTLDGGARWYGGVYLTGTINPEPATLLLLGLLSQAVFTRKPRSPGVVL